MGRIAPWILLAVLAAVYVAAALNPSVGLFHDDGVYLATAESLASGHGYRIASLPGEPLQTKYPILYPALLAGLWPGGVLLFKAFSVACTAIWVIAVFTLARRIGLDRNYAAWVAVAAVCGRWALFVFTAVLPDALFCALSTLALLHLMDVTERPHQRWWTWPALAGIECGAAFLVRTVGVALIVAGLLALAARRRYREAAVVMLAAGTLSAPWVLWQRNQQAPPDPVLAYYSKASYEHGSLLSQPGLERKAVVAGLNAVMLVTAFQALMNPPVAWAGVAVSLLLLIPVVRGTASGLRTLSLPAVWLAASALVLAGWLGPPFRYLLPLLPVAAIFIAVRARGHPRASAALAAFVAICAANTIAGSTVSLYERLPVSWAAVALDNPEASARLYRWIRANSKPGEVLAAANDPLAYRMTGRRAIRPFAPDYYELLYAHRGDGVGSANDLMDHLRRQGVRYLLTTPLAGFTEAAAFRSVLAEAQRKFPQAFVTRYREVDLRYSVIEVHPSAMLGK